MRVIAGALVFLGGCVLFAGGVVGNAVRSDREPGRVESNLAMLGGAAACLLGFGMSLSAWNRQDD